MPGLKQAWPSSSHLGDDPTSHDSISNFGRKCEHSQELVATTINSFSQHDKDLDLILSAL